MVPATTRAGATDANLEGFLPVSVDTLVPTRELDFDLFVRTDANFPPVMYRERSYPLSGSDLDRLARTGITSLYVATASHVAYCRYLRESVVENERLTPMQRYKVLTTANRAVFQSAYRSKNVGKLVDCAGVIGQQMTDVLCGNAVVLTSLLPMMAHDYYTYTHAANTCTYSLALAERLGITDSNELTAIATGALLHDVGKRSIPPSVLNHPGRLNEEQWALIRRHPASGFEELCLRDGLTWGQLMMVYQHHERIDGRGYPVGLVGNEIHPWAKICAVADVFDALSSERPYRKAEPLQEVRLFFRGRRGKDFEEEIVQCLLEAVGSEI